MELSLISYLVGTVLHAVSQTLCPAVLQKRRWAGPQSYGVMFLWLLQSELPWKGEEKSQN